MQNVMSEPFNRIPIGRVFAAQEEQVVVELKIQSKVLEDFTKLMEQLVERIERLERLV